MASVARSGPLFALPLRKKGPGKSGGLGTVGRGSAETGEPPPACPQSPRPTPRAPDASSDKQAKLPFTEVHALLCRYPGLLRNNQAVENVCDVLKEFAEENASIATSPNIRLSGADCLDRIVDVTRELAELLCDDIYEATGVNIGKRIDAGDKKLRDTLKILQIRLLLVLKILMRKQSNRQALGKSGVYAIGLLASRAQSTTIAREGANAVLNMCYEPKNIGMLVQEIGVKFLVKFLASRDIGLQASSAGALQSICYQYIGRAASRDHAVIERLAPLLHSDDITVQTRSVGAIHNMSSDPISIRPIRETGCLPLLVNLLGCACPEACTSAAGTIQNVSREPLTRQKLLCEYDVTEPLCNLLFGSDVQGQACAAGALLNLLGPEMSSENGKDMSDARASFKSLLADSVAMGAIWQSIFERKNR